MKKILKKKEKIYSKSNHKKWKNNKKMKNIARKSH